MSIQLPLLLASVDSLLPVSLGSTAAKVPLGDIHAFLILLAVAPSMVMLVILIIHRRRDSRSDTNRPLKNVGEAAETRQKQARKRSLRGVNEHSEPVFNAVSATQVVFQRPAKPASAAKSQAEAEPEDLTRFIRDAIEQLDGIATALHKAIPKARQAPGQAAPSAAAEEVSAGQLDTLDQSASRTDSLPLTSRIRDEKQALKRNAVDPGGPERNRHYLTFTLGDEQFAVSTENIQMVVEAVRLVAEPSTPPKIRQAIRLQDALVPVIDLGACFGGQPIELGRGSRIVILEVPSGNRSHLIGAVVDRVGEVLQLPPVQIEPPAASGNRIRDDLTLGTLKLDNHPVTLLDISRGFSTNELVQHSAARPAKQENQPA